MAGNEKPGVFRGATAGTNGATGIVPAPSAGSQGAFLRGDGTWAAVSAGGGGNVTGPVSSVDNTIAVYSGASGTIIKDTAVAIDGSNNLSGVALLTTTNLTVGTLSGVLRGTTGVVSTGAVDLTSEVTGALPIGNGGTGQTAKTAAFNALSPITTKGDIISSNGTNNVRLGVGTDGYVLQADSASANGIKWAAAASTGYDTILNATVAVTQRAKLNFTNSGISAVDNAGTSSTDVSLASGISGLSGYNTAGLLTQTASNTYTGRSVAGTASRIAVTNGSGVSGNPTVDIDSAYVGQSSITTLGTVTTGTWNGTVLGSSYGGTGVNNGSSTITLAGNLVTSGANSLTLTTTGATNVTLPTSGTLVNSGVTTLSSLASIGTITTGVWNGTAVGISYGGTGQTSKTAAFDALSPNTTKGDLTVNNGVNNIRLGVGTDTYVLTADSTAASGVKWAAGSGGYATIQSAGTPVTQRATLNFVGATATIADDAGNTRTNVTFASSLNSLAAYNTNGLLTQTAANTFTGRTATGTTNRLTVTNGDGVSGNPTFDISTSYVGQATITTLGTVTTGTYSASLKTYTETIRTDNSSTSYTINLANGNWFEITMTGNCTFAFSNVPATSGQGVSITLVLIQDGTGSRTATWPASVDWGTAGAPTLTTTATKADVITMITANNGTKWRAFLGQKGFAG